MSSSKRRLRAVIGAGALGASLWLGSAAGAAEDLSTLQVTPQRGQSADQARRDRYECHNWAIEQTGEVPVAVPPRERDEPSRAERRRAERADRAITGAVIGAGVGGIARGTQHKNPSNGVLAGAAVGAAVGAATGRAKDRKEEQAAPAPSDYLRALTACMEGRGYTVSLPRAGESVASR
jgi:hypothetical protein